MPAFTDFHGSPGFRVIHHYHVVFRDFMNNRVLVVEDEPAIAEMIQMSLQRNGYVAAIAGDIASARDIVTTQTVDIALVDWMLPGGSGIEFVRHLRKDETTRSLPIIMLTAKSEEQDITAGLDAGADDYVTKPFSPNELNSRVRALLRRSQMLRRSQLMENVIEFASLRCDSSAHRIYTKSQTETGAQECEIEMAATEFKLLQFLLKNPDRVFSRAQLLDQVWGHGTFIEERTVDVHILRLRKLLKPHALDSLIQTVRGAGYRCAKAD